MKFLKISLVFSVFALLLVFIVSCQKEIPTQQERESASEERSESESCPPFELTQSETVTNGRQAMAYAVSKVLHENMEFRALIYSKLSPDHHRFKEIVLGTISDAMVGDSPVKELLNGQLLKLEAFYGNTDPFGAIIQTDALMSLWFPNKFLNNLPEGFFEEKPYLPIYLNETAQLFDNDFVCSNLVDELVAFRLSSAQVHKLYDPNTSKYISIDTDFEDFHGFNITDCNSVYQVVVNKSDYVKGFKLIDPIDDVQNVYSKNCGTIQETPHGPDIPIIPTIPNGIECQRSSLEQKLLGNFTENYNVIEGFRITNMAAADHIAAHPCNEWLDNEGNGTRAFVFSWLAATAGFNNALTNRRVVHCYKTDLVEPGKITFGWKWSWRCLCHRRYIISSEPPKLKYFPMPFQMDLFAAAPVLNHWHPDEARNGDAVQIDVKLAYFGECENESQSTNTNQFKFGLNISGGLLKKALNALGIEIGTFEVTNTNVHENTFTVTGDKIYDLGNCTFNYCDPYPFLDSSLPGGGTHGLKWYQFRSTGSVDIHLKSPWK